MVAQTRHMTVEGNIGWRRRSLMPCSREADGPLRGSRAGGAVGTFPKMVSPCPEGHAFVQRQGLRGSRVAQLRLRIGGAEVRAAPGRQTNKKWCRDRRVGGHFSAGGVIVSSAADHYELSQTRNSLPYRLVEGKQNGSERFCKTSSSRCTGRETESPEPGDSNLTNAGSGNRVLESVRPRTCRPVSPGSHFYCRRNKDLLPDLELKRKYRSGRDALLDDFYIPCLQEAITYDRAVGYFSSSLLHVAALAFSDFVRRGGRMRLICSPALNLPDYEAMQKGMTEVRSRELMRARAR